MKGLKSYLLVNEIGEYLKNGPSAYFKFPLPRILKALICIGMENLPKTNACTNSAFEFSQMMQSVNLLAKFINGMSVIAAEYLSYLKDLIKVKLSPRK